MSNQHISGNEKEIEDVMERLRRSGIGRDAIALLVAKLIELKHPEERVEFASDSEVKLIHPDGASSSLYLHNLWAECERSPDERTEIVDRYLRVLAPDVDVNADERITAENIIPLIRDSEYRTFVKNEDLDLVTRHFISDLWIVYAADLPESTIVLTGDQVLRLGLDKERLFKLAVRNVEDLLGQMEFNPYGECFTISCKDVLYVSSALILDYVWDQAANLIGDEVVVAVPARDTVLFTGATNSQGLREIREAVDHVLTNGNHVITKALLKRIAGSWKLSL